MPEKVEQLIVELTARVDKLDSELHKGRQSVDGFVDKAEAKLKSFAATLGIAFGAQQIIQFTQGLIRAADEHGTAMDIMIQKAKNFGVANVNLRADVKAFTDEVGKSARFTRWEAVAALDIAITRLHDYGAAQEAVRRAQDLALISGMSLEEATTAVSLAMGGNTRALMMVSRQIGLNVKDGATLADILDTISKAAYGLSDIYDNDLGESLKQMKEDLAAAGDSALIKFLPPLTAVVKTTDALIVNIGKIEPFLKWFAGLGAEPWKESLNVWGYKKLTGGGLGPGGEGDLTPYAGWGGRGVGGGGKGVGGGAGVGARPDLTQAGFYAEMGGWLRWAQDYGKAIERSQVSLALQVPDWKAVYTITEGVSESSESIADTMGKVVDATSSWVSILFQGDQKMQQITNSVFALLRALATGNPWAIFGGSAELLGSIVSMQHGGIVMSPTMARIAEREPEAVIPLSQLQTILSGMPPINVNVHTHDPSTWLEGLGDRAWRNVNRGTFRRAQRYEDRR